MKVAADPLAGKRIVLTRTPEQAGILLRALQGSGASVITLPLVEFRDPEDWSPLDAALSRIQSFDWVVFTSQNAVAFLCKRLRQQGLDAASLPLPRPRVAAIGVATGEAVSREGLGGDIRVTNARSSKEFVSQIQEEVRGRRVLLPQSDIAKEHVAEALREGGADVTTVIAYRTCMPDSLEGAAWEQVRRDGADAFVFASPSAFDNFVKTIGPEQLCVLASRSAFAAIGPTTAEAIRRAGVPVRIEAATPSPRDMIEALRKYFGALASGATTS